MAEKLMVKRVGENDRRNWLEMGVVSITFTAYTAPDGQLVIDRLVMHSISIYDLNGGGLYSHDNMGDHMSLLTRPFIQTYEDDVKNMKRNLLAYMKTLRALADPNVLTFPTPAMKKAEQVSVKMTPNGSPILPDLADIQSYNKQALEDLLALYLGHHYSRCWTVIIW
jgi:hypothetical protein